MTRPEILGLVAWLVYKCIWIYSPAFMKLCIMYACRCMAKKIRLQPYTGASACRRRRSAGHSTFCSRFTNIRLYEIGWSAQLVQFQYANLCEANALWARSLKFKTSCIWWFWGKVAAVQEPFALNIYWQCIEHKVQVGLQSSSVLPGHAASSRVRTSPSLESNKTRYLDTKCQFYSMLTWSTKANRP